MPDMFRVEVTRRKETFYAPTKKVEYYESKEAVENLLFTLLGEWSETSGFDRWRFIQFRRASGIKKSTENLIQNVKVGQLVDGEWKPITWEITPPKFIFEYSK